MRLRAWRGPEDTKAIQRLASRCWPRGHHPGGIGWSGATEQLPAKVTLAVDSDGGLAGWAGVHGGTITLQADPASPAGPGAAEGLITWAVAVAEPGELTVEVFDGDDTVRTALTEAGFVPAPAAPPVGGMVRDLGAGWTGRRSGPACRTDTGSEAYGPVKRTRGSRCTGGRGDRPRCRGPAIRRPRSRRRPLAASRLRSMRRYRPPGCTTLPSTWSWRHQTDRSRPAASPGWTKPPGAPRSSPWAWSPNTAAAAWPARCAGKSSSRSRRRAAARSTSTSPRTPPIRPRPRLLGERFDFQVRGQLHRRTR